MATDLLTLMAKVKIDSSDYEKGIDKAESKSKKFAKGIGKVFKGIGVGIGAMTTAIGAVGGATVKIGKQAIEAYANYEQLVGGVETLFGKSADVVKGYADEAYKTAGLSANKYMETVTGFSASLLQSLGGDTKKASESANKAVIDMSDNANKMGTPMEMIQNAYQGFAKQNYTMLDNLKLGYGGTKEEMERLLKDAEKLTGKKYDISNFNDITEAIHAVQTETGITGTTAKEASTTIQGSVTSMKGAWENLLVGMADDNADFDSLVNNLVDSVLTVGDNLVPRIETTLNGVITAVMGVATKLLPELLPVVADLITNLLQSISDNLPELTDTLMQVLDTISSIILENLPLIISMGLQVLLALITGITDSIPTLIPVIVDVVNQIATTLTEPDTLEQIINATVELIVALAQAFIDNLPLILDTVLTVLVNIGTVIADYAQPMLDKGGELIDNLKQGISDKIEDIKDKASEVVQTVVDKIASLPEKALTWGKDMIDNLISGIKNKASELGETVSGIAQDVTDFLGFSKPKKGAMSKADKWMPDMIDLMTSGLTANQYKLTDKVKGLSTSIDDTMAFEDEYSTGGNNNTEFVFSFDDNGNELYRMLFKKLKVTAKEVG